MTFARDEATHAADERRAAGYDEWYTQSLSAPQLAREPGGGPLPDGAWFVAAGTTGR